MSIAGYGEMLYENYASDKHDAVRLPPRRILYAGYRFNDKFLFNSEIEVEHAKEIFVEFAYVDYLATENFGLRAGMLLIPMGLVNEFHEPTVFIGAERPVTEQSIIPATWRENGGGFYFAHDLVSARAYVVNGFNGSAFSSSGVRGGRQKGGKAKAGNLAITGRIDMTPTPGVFFRRQLLPRRLGPGRHRDRQRQLPGHDQHRRPAWAGAGAGLRHSRALCAGAARRHRPVEPGARLGQRQERRRRERCGAATCRSATTSCRRFRRQGGVGLTPYRPLRESGHARRGGGRLCRAIRRSNNTYTTFGVELKPVRGHRREGGSHVGEQRGRQWCEPVQPQRRLRVLTHDEADDDATGG